MEERINTIEEELKVLKSQIKAVLLDIKEYLATGNGRAYSAPAVGSGTAGPSAVVGDNGLERDLSQTPKDRFSATDLDRGAAEQAEPDLRPGKVQPAQVVNAIAMSKGGDGQVVDLLTISVLAQWLSRAIAAVGRNQTGKLVEIYDVTGNLPPRLKETMLLLADLYGESGQDEDTPVTEYVSAAMSIQLLIELDSLLRYRSGALESVVLSMLLDGGAGNRKVSDG